MSRTLIGVCVAATLLALLLYRVDLRQFVVALSHVHGGFLALGLVIQLVILWMKALRWGIAIRGSIGRPVRRAFSASMIGFAGNVLLPARLGELARVSVLDKHNQTGRLLALTAVGITQIFDLLVLGGWFFAISFWASSLLAGHRWMMALLELALLVTLGGMVILQHKSQTLRALLLPVSRRLPEGLRQPVTRHARLFVQGLGALGMGRVVGWVLLLTAVVWGLEIASAYLMLQAFHVEANFLIATLVVVVSSLSFIFPITPGNIGVVQVFSVLVLSPFGIPQASALAFSIGAHSATYLLIVSLGMFCFYHEGMSLNLLRRAAQNECRTSQW